MNELGGVGDFLTYLSIASVSVSFLIIINYDFRVQLIAYYNSSLHYLVPTSRPVACGGPGGPGPLRFAWPPSFFVSAGFRPRLAPPMDRAGPCCKIVTLRGCLLPCCLEVFW